MPPAEPAPGQLRRDLLPLRGRVARLGGRDQRRDRAPVGLDAAVWRQEADLPDPGAPSRLIDLADVTSRFLDILGGHHTGASPAPGRVAQRTSAGSPAVHEAKLATRRHACAV